jgi:hypothetical protein
MKQPGRYKDIGDGSSRRDYKKILIKRLIDTFKRRCRVRRYYGVWRSNRLRRGSSWSKRAWANCKRS